MNSRHFIKVTFSALLCILTIAFSSSSFSQQISTDNTSQFLGNGRWEWTVYINASPQVLKQIDCIEYTLHPTFPRPVQRVCGIGDKDAPFGLTATGWGTFQIQILVFMKDRRVVELTHDLRFSQ